MLRESRPRERSGVSSFRERGGRRIWTISLIVLLLSMGLFGLHSSNAERALAQAGPGPHNDSRAAIGQLAFDGNTEKLVSSPSVNIVTKVQPILFVPKNLNADPTYLPAIDEALETVSAWYASQLDGKTFNYVPAQEVIGQYELGHYCPKTISDSQCIQVPGEIGADPGDIYNVLSDLESQGYPVQHNTILFVFWVGGYGYGAGCKYTSTSGWAAVGDWALDGIAGKYEAGTATSNCSDSPFAWLWCTKNAQTGSVAHELGHAFGLPHPTDDGTQPGDPDYWLSTVMAVWWDFPDVVLIDSAANPERTTLLQHPFFSPWNLSNGSFEQGPRIPKYWRGKNLTLKDRRVCRTAHDGSCSFRILGTSARKSLRQVVRISGNAGDTFTLRGWSKARNPLRKGGPYCLQARVFHTDGTKKNYRTCFAKRTHTWQRRQTTFAAAKDYNKIVVYLLYYKQGGKAWFDDVRLVAQ